jgi:hypothetical protein
MCFDLKTALQVINSMAKLKKLTIMTNLFFIVLE